MEWTHRYSQLCAGTDAGTGAGQVVRRLRRRMAEERQFTGENPGGTEGPIAPKLGQNRRKTRRVRELRCRHPRLQRKEKLPMLSQSQEIGRQGASLHHRGERHRRDQGILLGVHGKGEIGIGRHHRSYPSGSVLVEI